MHVYSENKRRQWFTSSNSTWTVASSSSARKHDVETIAQIATRRKSSESSKTWWINFLPVLMIAHDITFVKQKYILRKNTLLLTNVFKPNN